jgi:hypothetical protein
MTLWNQIIKSVDVIAALSRRPVVIKELCKSSISSKASADSIIS